MLLEKINALRSLHRLFRENVFSTKMAKFRAGTNTLLKFTFSKKATKIDKMFSQFDIM